MENKNKVAVITGASGGIGKAIALKLASLNINLALLGRNISKLNEVKTLAEKFNVKAEIFCGSFFDEKYLSSLLSDVEKTFGKIDILINNAGKTANEKLEFTDMKLFDEIMDTNVRVPYLLCKDALKYLRKSDCATIINIASVCGKVGYENQSAYSASKHALIGFSESLAKEVYKENIRVHIIAPGGVFTDMVKISRPDLTGEGMIMPEDIADIVEFFITHRTNAVVDQISVHRIGKEPFNS